MARKEPTAESIGIGMRIQRERERLKMTREQLAESLDVTVWYITDIERGRTGLSVPGLMRLCTFFGCSCDYILFGTINNNTLSVRIDNLPLDLRQCIDDLVAAQVTVITTAQKHTTHD